MVASDRFTRVDTRELKDLIFQKIGCKRAEKYFDQLKKFISLKLDKAEFDKNCVEIIGRENISLHNQLIRSIIQNACHARVPPQKPRKVEGIGVKVANGYQRGCVQSLYGDLLPKSPRKCRSDRKIRDRPSPLGPLGKSPSVTYEKTVTIQEQQNATNLVEDGEEVDQFAVSPNVGRWIHVTAPLDVSAYLGAYKKVPHCTSINKTSRETCQSCGELPDSRSLMGHLQERLASEGIGISLDCANLLNKSLDVYLKRLIEPCLGIAGSHSNCLMTSELYEISHGRYAHRPLRSMRASMLDFRVAMELNPCVLGVDWSIQLEKICNRAMQE